MVKCRFSLAVADKTSCISCSLLMQRDSSTRETRFSSYRATIKSMSLEGALNSQTCRPCSLLGQSISPLALSKLLSRHAFSPLYRLTELCGSHAVCFVQYSSRYGELSYSSIPREHILNGLFERGFIGRPGNIRTAVQYAHLASVSIPAPMMMSSASPARPSEVAQALKFRVLSVTDMAAKTLPGTYTQSRKQNVNSQPHDTASCKESLRSEIKTQVPSQNDNNLDHAAQTELPIV